MYGTERNVVIWLTALGDPFVTPVPAVWDAVTAEEVRYTLPAATPAPDG